MVGQVTQPVSIVPGQKWRKRRDSNLWTLGAFRFKFYARPFTQVLECVDVRL
jgi:hypothetical protein